MFKSACSQKKIDTISLLFIYKIYMLPPSLRLWIYMLPSSFSASPSDSCCTVHGHLRPVTHDKTRTDSFNHTLSPSVTQTEKSRQKLGSRFYINCGFFFFSLDVNQYLPRLPCWRIDFLTLFSGLSEFLSGWETVHKMWMYWKRVSRFGRGKLQRTRSKYMYVTFLIRWSTVSRSR